MSPGDKYVRHTRHNGAASWFDVRDAYQSGLQDGLKMAAEWLGERETGPNGELLNAAWAIVCLNELAAHAADPESYP